MIISYFTGTGGTKMATDYLANSLGVLGITTQIEQITNCSPENTNESLVPELQVLLFTVHAFNAPEVVYHWADSLPIVKNRPAAVISVSGGGEMVLNTACRVEINRRLELRGYKVVYEEMVVMPCNVIIATPKTAATKLLKVLPQKMHEIAIALANHEEKHSKPNTFDRIVSRWGEGEKQYTKNFGHHITPTDACIGCGKCAKSCPTHNITMQGKLPLFGDNCEICMKCLYVCPTKALKAEMWSLFQLKDGYDLEQLNNRPEPSFEEAQRALKGVAWIGVKKYLSEIEKKRRKH